MNIQNYITFIAEQAYDDLPCESCKDCMWFEYRIGDEGICRNRPPVARSNGEVSWPFVDMFRDFCGGMKRAEDD